MHHSNVGLAKQALGSGDYEAIQSKGGLLNFSHNPSPIREALNHAYPTHSFNLLAKIITPF